MIERLRTGSCWIFDLDGTLTLPVHDFRFIRNELEIPDDADILGHLDMLHPDEALLRRQRLDEIEYELAGQAVAAPGVLSLLELLSGRNVNMGILTRNSRQVALLTLQAIGVAGYFPADYVLGRDEALPKPDPSGILSLVASWDGSAENAVMVGDYLFDLQAGRAAGTLTVHVGRPDGKRWPGESDVMVETLEELAVILMGR